MCGRGDLPAPFRAGIGAQARSTLRGGYHEKGLAGLAVDVVAAATCYRRAVQAGSGVGAFFLVGLLHDGRGVAQDRAEALRWFTVAAEAGDADALGALGRDHEEGWGGLAPDAVAVVAWYRRAVEAGNGDAADKLNRLLAGPAIRTSGREGTGQ